jgi:hypothetical protein
MPAVLSRTLKITLTPLRDFQLGVSVIDRCVAITQSDALSWLTLSEFKTLKGLNV